MSLILKPVTSHFKACDVSFCTACSIVRGGFCRLKKTKRVRSTVCMEEWNRVRNRTLFHTNNKIVVGPFPCFFRTYENVWRRRPPTTSTPSAPCSTLPGPSQRTPAAEATLDVKYTGWGVQIHRIHCVSSPRANTHGRHSRIQRSLHVTFRSYI